MRKASRHQGIRASGDGAAPPLAASRGEVSTRVVAARSPSPRPSPPGRGGRPGFRGGFTLTELMIAVLVLIVIILATSRIFSAASRVASLGQATSDVLQDGATIERQLRQDIAALSHEGFFAIRCVQVRNDARQDPSMIASAVGAPNAPLINPLLPPDAFIRADQLMFFTTGTESSQAFVASQGTNRKAQSNAACVYYGHAFQLPAASAKTQQMLQDGSLAADEYIDAEASFTNNDAGVYPWTFDPSLTGGSLPIFKVDEDAVFVPGLDADVQATQPNALQWLLARQAVLLADDGGEVETYLDQGASAQTLWEPAPPANPSALPIRNGRRDAVATQMNDIRDYILALENPAVPTSFPDWDLQRNRIGHAMSYPRAERIAPTMRRGDQALTNSVLGSACSAFRIDWTYADGVGNRTNGNGQPFVGMVVPPGEQPWFGLDERFPDSLTSPIGEFPPSRWGVSTFGQYVNYVDQQIGLGAVPDPIPGQPWSWLLMFSVPAPPVPDPDFINIERMPNGLNTLRAPWELPVPPTDEDAPIRVYEAFFGYNQDVALGPPEFLVLPDTFVPGYPPDSAPSDVPRVDLGYTPWPTAIRVTMTLHDTKSRLEAGREFQFVIKLPQRAGTP